MRIGLIATNREWRATDGPIQTVHASLHRLGHSIEVVMPGDLPIFSHLPEVALIWNGVHGPRGTIVASLRSQGVPVLVMERGFFGRLSFTQIDHRGFNHTASWAEHLHETAPADGQARFVGAWGCQPTPMRVQDGHVLILLQVPGDVQLHQSELRRPAPLIRAVEDCLPGNVRIHVRAHPLSGFRCDTSERIRMLDGELEEAIRDAAFAVTINSNSGNEALAMGCPVLCLGPSLYGLAGAARPTTLADLPRALRDMLGGWKPEDAHVRNYLHWLACRQWSARELAETDVLSTLISKGMTDEL